MKFIFVIKFSKVCSRLICKLSMCLVSPVLIDLDVIGLVGTPGKLSHAYVEED